MVSVQEMWKWCQVPFSGRLVACPAPLVLMSATSSTTSSIVRMDGTSKEKLWDEALATYRGGRKTPDTVYQQLQADVYDYRKKHERRIASIPEKIKAALSAVHGITYDSEVIEKEVGQVFGREYEADVKEWFESMSLLEKSGLTSEEVIAILLQEPIHYSLLRSNTSQLA